MSVILNSQFNYTANPKLNIAYSYGPPGQTGIAYSNGNYFTGYWGGWYNLQNNGFYITSLASAYQPINKFSTGYKLNYFPEINTTSAARVTNFSLAFDNSGTPYMGIQDNSGPEVSYFGAPQIKIRGTITGQWRGWYPVIFNNFLVPDAIGCYYLHGDNINLYARYSTDAFSTEYIVNSGSVINDDQTFRVPMNTGVNSQYINFPTAFNNAPYVIITEVTTGNEYYFAAINGRSNTGFYAIYSDTVYFTGNYLNILASDNIVIAGLSFTGLQLTALINNPTPTGSNYNLQQELFAIDSNRNLVIAYSVTTGIN
jgi:hypothetical protein